MRKAALRIVLGGALFAGGFASARLSQDRPWRDRRGYELNAIVQTRGRVKLHPQLQAQFDETQDAITEMGDRLSLEIGSQPCNDN